MEHKHFGNIMMTFFVVYTLAILFTVLSALPVKAVEYLDEFPPEHEFLQFIQTDFVDKCKDGTTITTVSYTFAKEPTLIYVEAYLSSDKENPISVIYTDFSENEVTIDIYIKNLNRVEWYQNPFEFREAYPNGICEIGTTL